MQGSSPNKNVLRFLVEIGHWIFNTLLWILKALNKLRKNQRKVSTFVQKNTKNNLKLNVSHGDNKYSENLTSLKRRKKQFLSWLFLLMTAARTISSIFKNAILQIFWKVKLTLNHKSLRIFHLKNKKQVLKKLSKKF